MRAALALLVAAGLLAGCKSEQPGRHVSGRECGAGARPELVGGKGRRCFMEVYETDAEMIAAAERGLAGDPEAALGLGHHFVAIGRFDQADRWFEIALATGNLKALEQASDRFSDSFDRCLVLRSVPMLERRLEAASTPNERFRVAGQLKRVREKVNTLPRTDCRLYPGSFQHVKRSVAKR